MAMGGFRVRVGGDGPVVAETATQGCRLLVRGELQEAGVAGEELHTALRNLALRDRDLAHDAFGVVCNCAGSWEDEYTEEHDEDALSFDEWMERIEYGGVTWVDDDGELKTSV